MKHDYSNPNLPSLIKCAVEQWNSLTSTLHEIQQLTGIPGLHTDINSEDSTAGVLERIQTMLDEDAESLEVFQSFDEDEE